ncbi:hypothetical protein BH18ACT10_BH18ACT10_18350 [soil metagenome]
MDRDEMLRAKRREILARLDSYDSGSTEDDRREEKAREQGREIGRQEALETGHRGLGSVGIPI